MEQKTEGMYKHQKNCMSEDCHTIINTTLFSEYTSELIEKYHCETTRCINSIYSVYLKTQRDINMYIEHYSRTHQIKCCIKQTDQGQILCFI